jgi:hypothetical protein
LFIGENNHEYNEAHIIANYDGFSSFNDGQTITTNSSNYDEVIEKLVDLDKLDARSINNKKKMLTTTTEYTSLLETTTTQQVTNGGGGGGYHNNVSVKKLKATKESINSLENDTFTKSSINTRHKTQNDLLKKSAVNLPRLDEPILSFEEYTILNNINQNLRHLMPRETYQMKEKDVAYGNTGNSSMESVDGDTTMIDTCGVGGGRPVPVVLSEKGSNLPEAPEEYI